MAHRAENSMGLLFNEALGQAALRYSPQSSRLVFREQHGGQPSPKKKGTGPSMTAGPLPMLITASPLSYDRRGRGRSFSLADVLLHSQRCSAERAPRPFL